MTERDKLDGSCSIEELGEIVVRSIEAMTEPQKAKLRAAIRAAFLCDRSAFYLN
jgi:hypothetical protein